MRLGLCSVISFFLFSCASGPQKSVESTKAADFGRLAIIQGPTSDTESLINILSPRLKNYTYEAKDAAGSSVVVEKYETVKGPASSFYKIDKIFVKGLKPNTQYTLNVVDEFRGKKSTVDTRSFQSLDIKTNSVNFATLSCMADEWRFQKVIDPMWESLRKANPDFVVLNGDIVYVDSFDFVERKKATESDIWQRYTDTLKRLPVYHWAELKPIFATWDDHDFGTNDGDRDFISKEPAKKLFRGLFLGKALSNNVWQAGPGCVTCELSGFGQRWYFMDDRTFRQPNKEQKKKEAYGHWGQAQHQWLVTSLQSQKTPAWIFNGNQVFNGKQLDFKEAFEVNHSDHFVKFINEVKKVQAPVVFSSGDIHFSEIMRIPKERLGYETYEITSSSMHSFTGDGWDNPMRVPGAFTKEYNFVIVKSQAQPQGLDLNVRALGMAKQDYFNMDLAIKKESSPAAAKN